MSAEDDRTETLSKLFDEGLELFNKIDKTDLPTNSSEVQLDIKKTMSILENATRLASLAGLFSTNESIDEVATADLKYLMLPALLGTLSLKLTSGERKEIVECAEIYFKDFLQRTNDYGLSDYTFKEQQIATSNSSKQSESELEIIKHMVQTRQTKIERYKEQKELQSKLSELKANMSNENVDEEIKRNHVLTMIKIFIYKAVDDIASIDMEKPMLDHMENLKKDDAAAGGGGGAAGPKPAYIKPKPLRPVIITKDEVQKAVFGAGYPGLPTMTVQEFYNQRVKDGIFPDPSKPKPKGPLSLQEKSLAGIPVDDEDEAHKIAAENKEEADDADELQRLRDKDEYKDDHRRGWGNRMNRS